ncbi:hypothetical protein [Aeromonas enteropelogenes]|uniref:hypothetical protein n=1 Tax=Aeromonas enteropelogenes TaxID=29489 RepID=UPI003BA071BA
MAFHELPPNFILLLLTSNTISSFDHSMHDLIKGLNDEWQQNAATQALAVY